MEWFRRFRERLRMLSVRTKVTLTVGGAVILLLTLSGYLTFRYWESQALAASEQQALMAARSVRATVESGLAYGRSEEALRSLERLSAEASLTRARVYGPDHRVVLSAGEGPGQAAASESAVWIPAPTELPRSGLVRSSRDGTSVRAFLPLAVPGASVLEVELPVGPVKEAMDRGARLGLGLAVASILILGGILVTMLEKEVVTPIQRMEDRLAGSGGPGTGREDELGRLADSIEELMEREEAVERLAEARGRRLAEREGLAEVGELAAEMAHELKRPLVNIRTAMEMLEQEYRLDDRGGAVFSEVERQLDRLRETMGDLFSLARPVELEARAVDLADVLDRALLELRRDEASEGVEVRRRYATDLPAVQGDPRRLEHALLNLMLNAVEAMEGEGTLTVSAVPADGEWVRVSVEDTGPGIPGDQLGEVARPFYSTKPLGTGLGLPLVRRVVAAHRGRFGLESEPGEGTRAVVELPAEPA